MKMRKIFFLIWNLRCRKSCSSLYLFRSWGILPGFWDVNFFSFTGLIIGTDKFQLILDRINSNCNVSTINAFFFWNYQKLTPWGRTPGVKLLIKRINFCNMRQVFPICCFYLLINELKRGSGFLRGILAGAFGK